MKNQRRLIRYWDGQASGYDRKMRWMERNLFGDTRPWIAEQAHGATLEVAVGTGLNLPHYPTAVALTGVEISEGMLDLARDRAARLQITPRLVRGDATALEFADGSFDTAVATFSLCAVPDDRKVVSEMVRVLRPGGTLLLADHVVAETWWLRGAQWLVERVTVPAHGEHFRRRPLRHVTAAGLDIHRHDRFKRGLIERLAARKPS